MNQNDKFVKEIIIKSFVLIFLEIVMAIIFFEDKLSIVFGLILGGGLSIVFFRVIYLNILIALGKEESKARNFFIFNYMIRYIMYGVILYIAAKSQYFNLFSTFLGFFTIKLVLYIDNVITLLRKK